jgi:Fe-S-cluster containining protein
LKINRERFISEYTDPRWPGTESFLLKHLNGACIFLEYSKENKQNLCRIHTFKPSCCRKWTQGILKTECQEGLKANWDLDIDSRGNISGLPDKIAVFKDYLNNLQCPEELQDTEQI